MKSFFSFLNSWGPGLRVDLCYCSRHAAVVGGVMNEDLFVRSILSILACRFNRKLIALSYLQLSTVSVHVC